MNFKITCPDIIIGPPSAAPVLIGNNTRKHRMFRFKHPLQDVA